MEAPGPAAAGPEPPETRAEAPDGAPQPPAYRLQDFDTLATVGTGTFGRVQLVKEKTAKHFFALKVMSIPDVIRLKQEQHVHNEKSVLKEVSHPFLVKLCWAPLGSSLCCVLPAWRSPTFHRRVGLSSTHQVLEVESREMAVFPHHEHLPPHPRVFPTPSSSHSSSSFLQPLPHLGLRVCPDSLHCHPSCLPSHPCFPPWHPAH
nr:cAMP-dependent protein kinase catalytic subunit PRKX isoform X3 [Manis javanica]